ncbi:hypothetical protein B0T24DRAFT_255903 [Lasiosphaeria ovina]|uniref:Uncharacterized protein n=1 Tax=Lasiosphaeria ovina TaxID=92902 RepID=A0AAE0KBZ0_9PEZI|nr:hypothetical protein B0T24DRAFT_255903 [Lasiosphaeria ovina]
MTRSLHLGGFTLTLERLVHSWTFAVPTSVSHELLHGHARVFLSPKVDHVSRMLCSNKLKSRGGGDGTTSTGVVVDRRDPASSDAWVRRDSRRPAPSNLDMKNGGCLSFLYVEDRL